MWGPNIFRMFHELGLTEAINDVAVFPDALIMNDALTGEEITRVTLGDPMRDHFGFPYAVIYRPDIHNVFIDACKDSPLVRLSVNQKVTGFEDTGDDVRVMTEAGEVHEGRALIGADGLWSKIRGQLVGDGKPRVSGHIAYRAVLPIGDVPEDRRDNRVILWAGPKTHLVTYPLHRGEIMNLVAVFHSDRYEEGWDTFGDPEELYQRFDGEHPMVMEMLDKIESWRMWVLCDREPIRDWSKGRVTLLGDAAHPMLQYLAQGACMATEDAVCLAHQLEDHGGDFESAALAYQAARYLRTARVQLMARIYGDIYHAAGATADLRKHLMGNMDGASYNGVEWLYGGVDDNGEQII